MSAYGLFTHEKPLDQGELDVRAMEAQTTVARHEVEDAESLVHTFAQKADGRKQSRLT